MLFKIVVDAFMHHWVNVVAEEEAEPEGLRRSIQHLVAYFCTNDGLIKLIQDRQLQQDFDILTDLFECPPVDESTQNVNHGVPTLPPPRRNVGRCIHL